MTALRTFWHNLTRYALCRSVSDPLQGGCIGIKIGPLVAVRSPLGNCDRYRVYWMAWNGTTREIATWKDPR